MADEKVPAVKAPRPLKRKLHVNWEPRSSLWQVKRAFNFVPDAEVFTTEALKNFLKGNPEVELVARYI